MDLFGLFHATNWISSLPCNTHGGFHIIVQVSVSFSIFYTVYHNCAVLVEFDIWLVLILDLRSSCSACFPMLGKVSLWIYLCRCCRWYTCREIIIHSFVENTSVGSSQFHSPVD